MTSIVSTGQQKFNFNSWNFCIVIKDNVFKAFRLFSWHRNEYSAFL